MKTYLMKISVLLFLLNVVPTSAQIQFAPYINIETDSWPEVVAIDDVNNDGLKDVVLGMDSYGDSPNNYKILVFLQNTAGTLNTPVAYPYGNVFSGITSIDIADLNNDGLNDVVIGFGNKVGLLFQNTSGTLDPLYEINPNTSIRSIKAKDLNDDGLSDIVIGTNSSSVKIYYQSNSTLFNEVAYAKPAEAFDEVEIGDINDDNHQDLVFISRYSSTVYVYYQNETGSFDTYTSHAVNSIGGVSIGDINNDGLNDVAVTRYGNSPSSKIIVLFQNDSTNLLNNPIEITAYDCPQPIEIADLNNDGINEIITVHGGWMKLSVYEQNSSLFNPYSLFDIPYASHYTTQGVDIGDINNDGRKDIAIADYNYGLVILYNISTLSTDENTALNNRYTIYPNPVTDSFTIKTDIIEQVTFEISDVNGKILITGNNSNFDSIDISHFQKGFYFLTLMTDSSRQTHKIIKQ